MSHPPPLFLRLNNETRGPFAWDRLRELAESGVITPATEASLHADGPWTAITETGDYAGIFPQRVQLHFKARPFKKVNLPSESPVDHHALIAAANQGKPALPTGGQPAAKPKNEVENILQLNREREKQAGLDELKPMPPRPNHRRRDYWIIIIGGNLAILLGLGSIAGLIITSMLAAFFTAGITWVMYGVMSRY
jgi:hypothetical protein